VRAEQRARLGPEVPAIGGPADADDSDVEPAREPARV
jgi:hypothetical protein